MNCCDFRDTDGEIVDIDFGSNAATACGEIIDTCALTQAQIDDLNRGIVTESGQLNISLINTLLKRTIECAGATNLNSAKTTMTTEIPVVNAAITQMVFENTEWDDSTFVSGNDFLVPADGRYLISAGIGANSTGTGGRFHQMQLFLTVNGDLLTRHYLFKNEYADNANLFIEIDPYRSGSIALLLNAGDTVQVNYQFFFSGAAPTVPLADGLGNGFAMITGI